MTFRNFIRTLFISYSEIFFLQSFYAGLFIFLIFIIHPNIGASGLISLLSAYCFAYLLGFQHDFLKTGLYTYNSLLVGFSIGYLFDISFGSILIIISSGVFTFILSFFLKSVFYHYLKIPILSLPFFVVSTALYLASYRYTNLPFYEIYRYSSPLDMSIPDWLGGFFTSLGAIVFMPDIFSGILIAITIVYYSRIIFLLSVIGFYCGILVSYITTNQFEFYRVANFNFILISVALGGIFFVPKFYSYIIAILGVFMSALLLDAVDTLMATYGVPVFTLPFNIVTLSFVYVLQQLNFKLLPERILKTPEKTLEYYLYNEHRFTGFKVNVGLPFSGCWTVWQDFDDKWTHKGNWKHAYDFVIERNGSTYANQGLECEDYYAFKKPVLSPCYGQVVQIVNSVADNSPGTNNRANNWGNYVIINTHKGYYVLIAHLLKKSIELQVGQWVEQGSYIAQCGNSGFSPQPHIHMHVQLGEKIGGMTIPFSITSYIKDKKFIRNSNLAKQQKIESISGISSFEGLLDFSFQQELIFSFKKKDQQTPIYVTVGVDMDPLGEYYLSHGNSKLYFNRSEEWFYFYRLEGKSKILNILYATLPMLPLFYRQGLIWQDYIPGSLLIDNPIRRLELNARLIFGLPLNALYEAAWSDYNSVNGKLSYRGTKYDFSIRFSNERIEFIKFDKYQLSLVDDHKLS